MNLYRLHLNSQLYIMNDNVTISRNDSFIRLHLVLSCPPLVEVAGTKVHPKECLVVDGRKVNDTCTFNCTEGYKLPDPNQPTLTCLDTGAWDKAVINCQSKLQKEHALFLLPIA